MAGINAWKALRTTELRTTSRIGGGKRLIRISEHRNFLRCRTRVGRLLRGFEGWLSSRPGLILVRRLSGDSGEYRCLLLLRRRAGSIAALIGSRKSGLCRIGRRLIRFGRLPEIKGRRLLGGRGCLRIRLVRTRTGSSWRGKRPCIFR